MLKFMDASNLNQAMEYTDCVMSALERGRNREPVSPAAQHRRDTEGSNPRPEDGRQRSALDCMSDLMNGLPNQSISSGVSQHNNRSSTMNALRFSRIPSPPQVHERSFSPFSDLRY